jgi:photosystem II stability/assembly factor-like uncharacterized protein
MRLRLIPFLCCCFVAVGLAACQGEDPVASLSEDALCVVGPDTLNFGIVQIGQSSQAKFTIRNNGTGTMGGTVRVGAADPCDGFSIISGGGAFSLREAGLRIVTVEFDPAAVGDKTCTIDFGEGACRPVHLAGRAESPPECQVEPVQLDFGTIEPGTNPEGTFTITNTGGSFLRGFVEDSCPDVVLLSGGGAYRLGAGESRTVRVQLRPSSGVVNCTISTGTDACDDVVVTGFSELPAFAATAIGLNGMILRTEDGGESWFRQSAGTNVHLYSVSFVDTNIGTIVGRWGTVLRTSDGGQSWVKQSLGGAYDISRVHFTDADNGTIIGFGGLVFRTVDGGESWVSQSTPTSEHLTGVYFADAMTGCAIGWWGTVLWTDDGGATWEQRDSGTDRILDNVWLFDKQSGVITASRNAPTEQLTSQVLLTRDGGQTWTIIEPAPDVHFNNLAFVDSRRGIIVGSGGEVLWTGDGGMTWIQQDSGAYNLNGVSMLDPQTAVAVGYGGAIFQTVNGGAEWVQRISGTSELLNKVQVMAKP